MKESSFSQTGAGSSALYRLDPSKNPFSVGFAAAVTGTVSYTIEHTFDGTNYFPHASVAAQTASKDGNYAFPCYGMRVTLASGSGTVVVTVIQAG